MTEKSENWQRLLVCVCCQHFPSTTPVFNCKTGHIICASCFAVLTHACPGSKITCRECDSEITDTRNMVAEQLLQQFYETQPPPRSPVLSVTSKRYPRRHRSTSRPTRNRSESAESVTKIYANNNMMSSHAIAGMGTTGDRTKWILKKECGREMLDDMIGNETDSLYSVNTNGTKSLLSLRGLSRRPITCPNPDCGRMVAVTSFASHFQFEHVDVQQLKTSPEEKTHFSINSKNFTSREFVHQIGLLLVGDKKSSSPDRNHSANKNRQQCTGSQSHDHFKFVNRVPLILMIAHIQFPIAMLEGLYYSSDEDPHAEGKMGHKYKASSKVQATSNVIDAETCFNDFFMIWVSGIELDVPIRCTIEMQDVEHTRRHVFRGPINSLRDNQQPKAIYCCGNNLAINRAAFDAITSNCTKPFLLNVTIH